MREWGHADKDVHVRLETQRSASQARHGRERPRVGEVVEKAGRAGWRMLGCHEPADPRDGRRIKGNASLGCTVARVDHIPTLGGCVSLGDRQLTRDRAPPITRGFGAAFTGLSLSPRLAGGVARVERRRGCIVHRTRLRWCAVEAVCCTGHGTATGAFNKWNGAMTSWTTTCTAPQPARASPSSPALRTRRARPPSAREPQGCSCSGQAHPWMKRMH